LEAVVGSRTRNETGGVERLPLTAGAQDEEDGVSTVTIGTTRATAAKGMGVDVDREEELELVPEFVGDAPAFDSGGGVHGLPSCIASWLLLL
jgi:hypothetical protein